MVPNNTRDSLESMARRLFQITKPHFLSSPWKSGYDKDSTLRLVSSMHTLSFGDHIIGAEMEGGGSVDGALLGV